MSKALLGGKYALDRRLGGGGMAEVFLAHAVGAEGFKRPVAIKRVLAGYSNDPRFAQMFVSEAQLSSRLQHPNIVNVLDFDRDDDDRLYLVMELVDGPSLDELGQTGLVPFGAIEHVAVEVLRGLGYAHDLPTVIDGVRGVVHRDVSPHNVLLSWEGAVKVSDFGIAKARAASSATASEMIKGKPAYMSPEQANGEKLDGRSDLFAVGVMLWELLCGRTLFSGQTTQETLARLLFAPIPSPRQMRPDLPADLERVVMRLLERKREDRYPDAQAAIADLVACEDFPRGGRELMVALLGERFVDRAPQRSTTGSVVPTVVTPPSGLRDLPRPLDATKSLRGTDDHPRVGAVTAPRPARRIAPVAVAVLAAAGGGAAVWIATRGDAPVATAAPLDAMIARDTGADAPTVADAAVDAAFVDAAAPDAAAAPKPRPRAPSVDDLKMPGPLTTFESAPPDQPDPQGVYQAIRRVKTLGAKYCPTWYKDVMVDGRFRFNTHGIVVEANLTPPELARCVTKVLRSVRFPVSMEGGEGAGLGFGLVDRP